MKHLAEDVQRMVKGLGPVGVENYKVGEQIAASQGKVILRNSLMELIQYSPHDQEVYAEPVLIVPAWIMKYYILDLSPKNSLVKYLTGLGHTVFMISWKNPTAEDRDLSDGRLPVARRARRARCDRAVVPKRKVHGSATASAARCSRSRRQPRADATTTGCAVVTLFAAQTDFSEPGELSVFISPAQLAMLEAMMWKEGVLDSRMMGGAFQMLRTYDLLWSPPSAPTCSGERAGLNDLMAWNADGTRMAYRMHTDYLHQLYLQNDLAEGRYVALGDELDLANVTVPMFVVGTETDHVAPWRSVYKVGKLVRSADFTFCLTSGGHNAGIISGPQHPKRRHRVRSTRAGTRLLSADSSSRRWSRSRGRGGRPCGRWLAAHSSAAQVAAAEDGRCPQGLQAASRTRRARTCCSGESERASRQPQSLVTVRRALELLGITHARVRRARRRQHRVAYLRHGRIQRRQHRRRVSVAWRPHAPSLKHDGLDRQARTDQSRSEIVAATTDARESRRSRGVSGDSADAQQRPTRMPCSNAATRCSVRQCALARRASPRSRARTRSAVCCEIAWPRGERRLPGQRDRHASTARACIRRNQRHAARIGRRRLRRATARSSLGLRRSVATSQPSVEPLAEPQRGDRQCDDQEHARASRPARRVRHRRAAQHDAADHLDEMRERQHLRDPLRELAASRRTETRTPTAGSTAASS